MVIEKIKISEVKPYENNTKLHPKEQIEQIKKSISEFGFNDPIAVDKDNIIVEGHGRYLALLELGIEEVEIIRLGHLTEAQRKAYSIAHNKITMNSDFDFEKLKIELEFLNFEGFDFELTGFEIPELETEFPDLFENITVSENEDNIPEIDDVNPPYNKKGDLWLLGSHKLLCGDSLLKNDVEKLMDGELADLIITDPPYNVNYEGVAGKIQNDSMKSEDFYNFLFEVYSRLYESAKDGAGIYVFHADSEGHNFRSAMINAKWKNSQCCIWVKNTIVMGRQDYHWKHEPILVGWKPTGAHKWYSDRKQSTVWNFDKPSRNDIHPTMKPIPLLIYPIQNSSQKGDIVLDLFGGSGSTLVASEETGRKSRLMEIDEKYADCIVKRYYRLGKEDITLIRNGEEIKFSELRKWLDG